jgi:hypothetical protein
VSRFVDDEYAHVLPPSRMPLVFTPIEGDVLKVSVPEKVLLSERRVEEAEPVGHVVRHVSPVRQNVVADNTEVLAVVVMLGYGWMLLVAELYVQPTVTADAVRGRTRRAARMIKNLFIS